MLEVAALSGVARVGASENISSEQIFERNMGMNQADHQNVGYCRERRQSLYKDSELGAC